MANQRFIIFFFVGGHKGKEFFLEPLLLQKQTVGNMNGLPGSGQVKILRQVSITLQFNGRDLLHLGGYMIILLRLMPLGNGKGMGLAVKGGIMLGYHFHSHQPVGTGSLYMDVPMGHPAHGRKYGELIGTGVYGKFVTEMVCDFLMNIEIPCKIMKIPGIFDAFFKFAGEMRRHADGPHPA